MSIEQALDKKKWAIVGASENTQKYGCKILKKLKQLGYEVYAVNPNYETILGDKCYPDLLSIPEVPDVVNIVVSPKYGIKTVEEAMSLGIKQIWLQPGTVSKEILELANSNGIEAIQACVLVEGK